MKLKTIALAVLVAANSAYAAPALQSCSPMEVTHNGTSGLSYTLACEAGGWALKYTGSVPAGTESVMARYRLQATNPDGSNFTENRSVRLPSPGMLGQALVREAVVLDNGDLALRDCADFGCTLYRPLGNTAKLAKATVTVTPEVKRLTDELGKRQADLAAQDGKVAGLQKQVSDLSTQLNSAQQSLAAAKSALDNAKDQYTADVNGLLTSGKADVANARAAAEAKSSSQIADLTAQLAARAADLDKARKDMAECMAAHQAAEAAKAKADAEVDARGKKVAELQAALTAADAHLKSVLDGVDAKMAALNSKNVQASTPSADVAAMRLKLDAANRQVEGLLAKVVELERALTDANKQLVTAQAAQTEHAAALNAAASSQDKGRSTLEAALADAQHTIETLNSEQAAKVGHLQASLAEANRNLAAAQAQLTAVSARQAQAPTTDAAGQVVVLTAQLAEVTAQRDAAVADGRKFMADLDANAVKINQLTDDRRQALIGAKQVAQQMLEALDKFQDLQQAKADVEKALDATTNKVMELSTKLQAATMTRDLAMQAVGAANADADTQNLKNQELTKQLAQAQADQASLRAERDALAAKLQSGAAPVAVQAPVAAKSKAPAPTAHAAQGVSHTDRAEVDALTTAVGVLRHDRNKLQADVAGKSQRIEQLESLTASQAKEIEELRRQLASQTAAAHP